MQSFTPRYQEVPLSVEEELARVNHQMYERNVELAVRNRTLSILRKMYEIINTSLEPTQTAQRLIDAIVQELKFQKGFIVLIDNDRRQLSSIAVSRQAVVTDSKLLVYDKIFQDFKISLREDDNLFVKSVFNKRWRMTNALHDILTPSIDEKTAKEIQEKLMIKTSIIYPIMFAGEVLGTLMLGIDKHVGDLSRSERETLHELIEVVGIAIERAQIYEDLKNANSKLKELDKLKDEFVSLASHELRTPMTAIKSYLWMTLSEKGGPISEKQKFYLDRAYNSASRLIKLVNDMLNVSRIESGRITLAPSDVDLVKLASDVAEEVKPRAEELGVQVIITPQSIPHVVADADKIKEVLINLIGNSIKFTPKGGTITISFQQNGTMIITSVKDTGVGLSQENINKLFQKFALIKDSYQTNKTDTEGTGLGLYICKSIVELHGGQIWAESEGVGQGTIVNFSLKQFVGI